MTNKDIIIKYSKELEKISDTPRLDVELLYYKKFLVEWIELYIHLNLIKSLSEDEE